MPDALSPSATAADHARSTAIRGSAWCDFDLHGMVGIRLVGASPDDRAAVARQLGPIASALAREPDIVIRFVERLRRDTPLELIGLDDTAYTGDDFFLLRARHKARTRVQIAFDAIGGRCEIVCERGVPAVPLLLAIVNLTVLARGGLALHASAFRYRGTGVLVTGWSKGGKTELLLGFVEHGAEYIGDEWIYITPEGDRMYGIPEPIRVWDWQLEQLPRYWEEIGAAESLRLATLRQAHRVTAGIANTPAAHRMGGRRPLRRLADLIDRQRYAFLAPARTFGAEASALAGSIDRVVFVGSSEDRRTRLEPVSASWIAERMVHSLAEERSGLLASYRRFRFAFPHRANPLLDGAAQVEQERLHRVLADKPCYALLHPYPPSIRELFETAAPIIPA
ncbi:MAG TPA: hypothetical protein VFT96_03990 [Gemmatimonadaceae bacterium]|nr:hypothetical protein [Gemmatimonadaceae bacterium]